MQTVGFLNAAPPVLRWRPCRRTKPRSLDGSWEFGVIEDQTSRLQVAQVGRVHTLGMPCQDMPHGRDENEISFSIGYGVEHSEHADADVQTRIAERKLC